MDVEELLASQHELESQLQALGPVQFVRQLVARATGAQVLAHDARQLPGNRRATRFLFIDPRGAEAFLTVFSEIANDGRPSYTLMAETRELV